MTILKGLGDCGIATTDLSGGPSAQVLYPYPAYEFEFAQEVDSADAEAYRAGKRVTEETLENKVTSTLKLKTQIANWQLFGLGFGMLQRTITSLVMPKIKRTTVPAGGVISDAAIVTGNLSSVLASIERYGSWGQTGPLARASSAPTAGQVQVAAGTLTFHASAVGAPIMYLYDETIASVKAYGGSGTLSTYGELQFVGEVYDNTSNPDLGGRIWFPRCSRKTRPSLTYSGDIPELEIELSVLSPTGWPEPFLMIDGHSITA
jgi:hypothetical protein